MVMKELDNRRRSGVYTGTFKPQSHFFGYEGRCALPSNFDSQYCAAIGMNAAYLMFRKCNGYMSCVKDLGNPDPSKWIAAGCPLPAMMGIERRKGEDKPVITKALVELDAPMFTCYAALRNKWALLDCYQSPGPIQFKGAGSGAVNFMVSPPNLDTLTYETDVQERYENRHLQEDVIFRQESSLSELSRSRIRANVEIPDFLRKGMFKASAIKKYSPDSLLVETKIQEQFPYCNSYLFSSHFVELQDQVIANHGTYHF